MTQLNFQLPILGQVNSSEDPKVHDALQQIQTVVNGQLGSDNIQDGSLVDADIAQSAKGVRVVGWATDVASATSQSFTTTQAVNHLIVVSTTGIANVSVGSALAGIQLLVDTTAVATSEMLVDASVQGKHLTWPLLVWRGSLTAGVHSLHCINGAVAVVDANDRMAYVVLESF